ncbi:MAG: disulfide bond formation protein B [Alphaproteobacteria bacterium]
MIKTILSTPRIVFALITLLCFGALAAAFIAEGILNLEPCRLCIYQRYPFALGLVFGIIGMVLHKKARTTVALFLLSAINFALNSAIAFYHTGVEQHWWKSSVEGCAIIHLDAPKNQSILENIMSAPLGDCSKIPWSDPIFGLSMANYNIPFCMGLCILCLISTVFVMKSPKDS